MSREVFYYEISRLKLGLGKLSFVLSIVCELFGKFYSWARRTKVRNYGAFALSKPLDGSTRVRWLVAPRFHRRISCLLPGLPAQFWRKEHGRRRRQKSRCRGKTCRQHFLVVVYVCQFIMICSTWLDVSLCFKEKWNLMLRSAFDMSLFCFIKWKLGHPSTRMCLFTNY